MNSVSVDIATNTVSLFSENSLDGSGSAGNGIKCMSHVLKWLSFIYVGANHLPFSGKQPSSV